MSAPPLFLARNSSPSLLCVHQGASCGALWTLVMATGKPGQELAIRGGAIPLLVVRAWPVAPHRQLTAPACARASSELASLSVARCEAAPLLLACRTCSVR